MACEDGKQQREAIRLIAEARVKTGDFIARLLMAYAGFVAFCVFTLLSPDRLMIVQALEAVKGWLWDAREAK